MFWTFGRVRPPPEYRTERRPSVSILGMILMLAAEGPGTGLITNPAAVLGILLAVLAIVFRTSEGTRFRGFYRVVPALLLCYFIPGVLATSGLVADVDGRLYHVASRYLLPACLVMLTMSADLPSILKLGPKMLLVFIAATVGVVLGAPLAVLIVGAISPDTIGGDGPDAVWRGLATLAGSWIGGGANQAAMKEVFSPSDDLFSATVAVDVIVANVWMGVLLWMAGANRSIDRLFKADRAALEDLNRRLADLERADPPRSARTSDLMTIVAIGFAATGFASLAGDALAGWFEATQPWAARFSLNSRFFWLIVLATTLGVGLSFVRPVRKLEAVGASRIASVFLYLLVATIGLKMDLFAIGERPGLFAIGAIWISFQAILVLGTTIILRAPIFFAAVGSQANIGGAASAPVVAAAFDPRLAPVGVLLAVVGYALGTYGAWLAAQLMRIASGG